MARTGRGSLFVTLPSQAAARSARTPSFIPLDLTSPSNQIRRESIKARLAGGEQGAQSLAREMRGREITLLLPAVSGRGSGRGCRCAGGALSGRHQSQGSARRRSGFSHPFAPAGPGYPASCPPREGERWAELGADLLFPPTQASVRRTASSSSSSLPCRSSAGSLGILSLPKAPLAPHAGPGGILGTWMVGQGTCSGGCSVQVPPPCPCHRILPAYRSLPLPPQRPAAFLTPSGSDALPRLDPAAASTLERGEELRAAPVHPFYRQVRTHESSQQCHTGTLPAASPCQPPRRHAPCLVTVKNWHKSQMLISLPMYALLGAVGFIHGLVVPIISCVVPMEELFHRCPHPWSPAVSGWHRGWRGDSIPSPCWGQRSPEQPGCTSFDLIAQSQIHLANSLLLPLHYVGDPRHLQLIPFGSRKKKKAAALLLQPFVLINGALG